MIHTFGDSHAWNGWYSVPGVITHHISGTLCYSFGRDALNRINIKSYNVKENDTVIFCFGEVDCRCHINKYITEENTYETIINKIIISYFEAIKINVTQYNNLKVCVYNVVPPVYKNNQKLEHNIPFLGTDEERKLYILYFNKILKEKCNEYNYVFFDIYDNYADANGFLLMYYSDSSIHIHNGYFLHKFILENNLA